MSSKISVSISEITTILKGGNFVPLSESAVVPITTRYKPCGCGCKGADSWHKPTISRKVRNLKVERAPVHLDSIQARVATGEAQMPWGMEPVQALVSVFPDGRTGRYADWILVDLK